MKNPEHEARSNNCNFSRARGFNRKYEAVICFRQGHLQLLQ